MARKYDLSIVQDRVAYGALRPPSAAQKPKKEAATGKGGVGVPKMCKKCSVAMAGHCCGCHLRSIGKQGPECKSGKNCKCTLCINPKAKLAKDRNNANQNARREIERQRHGTLLR